MRLGDVVKISPSSKQLCSNTYWLLNLDMVEQQTGAIIEYNYVTKDQLNGSIIKFDTDNVLYSKLRPNLNKVVLPSLDGFATSEMLPLKPDTSTMSKEYLAAYLRSDTFVSWAVSKTAGAKMPRLGTKELLNKDIPVPSLEEQARISGILSKIDNLISLRKQQLAKLDELVKARFVEMFGDPITNSKNLPTKDLIQIVKLQRGYDLPIQSRERNGGIPVYGSNGILDYHNQGKAACGVVTGRSGTIGKVYYCKEDFWPLNTTLFSIETYSNDIIYLAYLLRYYNLERFCDGTGVPTLNRNIIHKEQIIDVPISQQITFSLFVQQVEQSKLTIQQSRDKLKVLKKSLMQEYFG